MPGKKRIGEVSTYQAKKFHANQTRKQANKMGAEGPKRSIARGPVTRAVPGGGRKVVGPNKTQAALRALANETTYKKPKKRGK